MKKSEHSSAFEFEFNVDQDLQLDLILEQIAPLSEDIDEFIEQEYYKTRWLQLLEPDQQSSILHIFFPDDNEYLYSLDGDILFRGSWKALDDNNSFIIDRITNNQVTKSEFFDLAYLSEDFFILKKHGDQSKKGKAKYLFLVSEEIVEDHTHEEILSMLRKEGYSFPWHNVYFIAFVILAILLVFKYLQ